MIHFVGVTPHVLGSALMYYDRIYFMQEPIDPYLDALRDSGYPQGYIDLIIEHVQKLMQEGRFLFEEGAEPRYDSSVGKIILPPFRKLKNPPPPHTVLPHLLTSFFRKNPTTNSNGQDYLSYIKETILEFYIASSSEDYGYAEALAEGENYKPQGIRKKDSQSFQPFAGLEPEEIRILLESAIYIIHNNNISKNLQLLNIYTENYNANNGTNHQLPLNGLEPPMLPPTLARLVLPIIEKIKNKNNEQNKYSIQTFFFLTGILPQRLVLSIFEKIYNNQQQQDSTLASLSKIGLNVAYLKLAAEQKTWPTYQSQVLAVMPTNANSLG